MIQQDDFYTLLVSDFREKIAQVDFSHIYSYTTRDNAEAVREYAERAIAMVQNAAETKINSLENLANGIRYFIPRYIDYVLKTKKEICLSIKMEACKKVITACHENIVLLKEMGNEVVGYIHQLKNQKANILDSEQLEDSTNIASLNGEDVSIEDIKERFEDNAYIQRLIINLQKSKNNNKEKLEFIDYEIGSLRLLRKAIIKKKTGFYEIKNRYLEMFRLFRDEFNIVHDEAWSAFNNLVEYTRGLNTPQKKFMIETLKIKRDTDDYGKHHILNWVKGKREEMKGYYSNVAH